MFIRKSKTYPFVTAKFTDMVNNEDYVNLSSKHH